MVVRHELAESALAELMFEEPGAARCLIAPDGTVARASEAWLRARGLTRAQALGADVFALAPEIRDAVARMFARVGSSERVTLARQVSTANGARRCWEGVLAPLPTPGGTALLLTERELPAPRDPGLAPELLSSAIQSVDVCLAIMTGAELRFTLVNPAYERFAPGVPMLGRTFREVFPEAAEASEDNFRRVLETGDDWHIRGHHAPVRGAPNAVWDGEASRLPAVEGQERSLVVIARNVTERFQIGQALVRSEEALRCANEKLRGTLDAITDGVVVLDHDWRYIQVSERAAQIVGMRSEQLLGKLVWEVFPGTSGTRFEQGFREARAAGKPVHFEEYYPAPLDQWLECHCYPSERELTVYFRDVSDRRRTEDALRESSALLRAISDASPDVIFAKDREGRIRFANPATLALVGKPAEAVLGRTDAEFLEDKAAAENVMTNDARIMQGGLPEELEESVPLADGTERVWLSRKMPFRDQDGKVVGLLGISRDITERKRAADELQRAHAALQRILASITDGLAVLDRDWRYTYFSETGARMLRLRREDVLGRVIWEAFPYANESRFGQEYRRAVETGQPTHFEEYYPAPLNVWIECHCYPSEDGLSVYFRDVSERKRAEEALRDGDRRKDEFIAILAHELRNPLAPVRNAVEILRRLAPPEPRLDRARAVIDRQVTHMARLIDDLLDVSRISRGKLALQRQRCDFAEVARQTAADYRMSFDAAGLTLVLPAADAPLWVDGDSVRLAQMVGNLLNNAARFTGRGGRVEVSATANAGHALVRVTDTGVGMDPGLLARLFDPFSQAEQDLARSKGGLGLGLALTKGLIELHGGSIEAFSEGLGRGATFALRLPLSAPAAESGQHRDGSPSAPPLSIVIIEDNPDVADSLGDLLELSGHAVKVAYDGAAGLALVRERRPQVVISDLGLPGTITGFDLGRAIRAEAASAGTFLIALSGYANEEARKRSAAAGFDLHLAKPPDLRKLQQALAAVAR